MIHQTAGARTCLLIQDKLQSWNREPNQNENSEQNQQAFSAVEYAIQEEEIY
jgi:hypothetical protein